MGLKLEPNLARPDELYAAVLDLHEGLQPEASARLNFRLILLLMNHIGDESVIREALAAAVASGTGGS
jgi:hypothetical protein